MSNDPANVSMGLPFVTPETQNRIGRIEGELISWMLENGITGRLVWESAGENIQLSVFGAKSNPIWSYPESDFLAEADPEVVSKISKTLKENL